MQDKQETRRQKAEPNTNPYYTRNPNMNRKSNIKPEHKRPTACNTTRIKQTTMLRRCYLRKMGLQDLRRQVRN